MHYYLVAIGSNKYHGSEPLTYASTQRLEPGSLVEIPVRAERYLGFVVESTTKPAFATKELVVPSPELPPVPAQLIRLFTWIIGYYPAPLGITTQLFLPKSLPGKRVQPQIARTLPPIKPDTLPPLTKAQAQTLAQIEPSGTHVLFGDTGSGKTRVYIELAKEAVDIGRSAIILTPEISLTSQLVARFTEVFGRERIAILHSHMTAAERRDTWYRIAAATEPLIIIGARSALFAPCKSVGLIVLDESHEAAYKQENAPHYHAVRVAAKLAELCGARVVFGSATPSLTDYYVAEARKRPIVRLTGNATGSNIDVATTIVDLRNRSTTSRNAHLSDTLLHAIDKQLQSGSQTLLFLNRRGTARIVLCTQCGWQALCPRCDLPLTYHHDSHRLRCHACDYAEAARTSCPNCGNTEITLKSIGTKTIASTIERFFPTARVMRFDADNKVGERLHEQYANLRDGSVDVIIGTQLLAKGLDLPHLGLIGVINADSSLYIPDFSAQERTYQLLHQVLGRVGRGHSTHAAAIIQTYSPDNPTIQSAIDQSWGEFYKNELAEREAYNFPPFCHLLKVHCSRSTAKRAEAYMERIKSNLLNTCSGITVEGPAPAFHEKAKNSYVWQLIIKSKRRQALLNAITNIPKDCSFDIDPIDLL